MVVIAQTMRAARRPLAGAAAICALAALGGCGASDDKSGLFASDAQPLTATAPKSAGSARTTPATTRAGTTTSPATGAGGGARSKAASGGSAGTLSAGTAKAGAGAGTGASGSAKKKATTPPDAPTGVAAPPGPKAPVACLEQAGLDGSGIVSPQIWAGRAANGRQVLIDGPYTTADEAKTSAEALQGVTLAKAAGVWVVSAALRADVDSEIDKVAECIRDKPAD